MNFTPDYITLCKNEKVQGLKEFLSEGDYCVDIDSEHWFEELITDVEWKRIENRIWLPTSDQLDEIILNICKEKFNGYFQYEMCYITTEWYGTIRYWQKSKEYMKDDELMRYAIKIDENPLICKLKLLISLLKEE